MVTKRAAVLLAALVAAACDLKPEPLPEPAPLRPHAKSDAGFPIKPRPACSADVIRATKDLDPRAIAQVAAKGATFTCGSAFDPLPLDVAVMQDASAAVRALLQAGADPNARWGSRGDRFPLQEAIEARHYGWPNAHREHTMALLLQHGADPNARWCPFETRGLSEGNSVAPCTSDRGVSPLIMATLLDEPRVASRLVRAKANPALEDWHGANALDYVRSEGVFAWLRPAFFPGKSSESDILEYLNRRHETTTFNGPVPGPWDETPLTRAIYGASSIAVPPPLPGTARSNERVQLLLRLGADPNRRLTWTGVDWTPLALALFHRNRQHAEALLESGADPNMRWCVPLRWQRDATDTVAQICESSMGTTPLMLAASLGRPDYIALLLRYGADRMLRDWQGRTAADHAANDPNDGIKALLE